jgi:ribosomal protein S18 acetylase RimI-like enzyme
MIRKVRRQDLPVIVNIEDQSFDVPWPYFVFRSYLGSEGFVLYEQDGVVMGYAIICRDSADPGLVRNSSTGASNSGKCTVHIS